MIFVIVLDTSASMAQRSPWGMSILDVAKATVEAFVRLRNERDPNNRTDRYVLSTTDETDPVKVL